MKSRDSSGRFVRDSPPTREEQKHHFWTKVKILGPNDCWEWQEGFYGKESKQRYGCYDGERAHRVAYELIHGTIPDGLKVLHTCDNPPCVNPAHLFLGTQADNMADMKRKGRTSACRGETNVHAKLSDDKVKTIRTRYANGGSPVQLSREFGIALSTFWKAIWKQSWKHVQ